MSEGLYTHTTRATGTTLTAAIYNSDHIHHITNQNPTMTGAYSDNVAEMQAVFDPGDVSSENLPTNLADELGALRYVIKRMLNAAQWYEDVGVVPSVDSTNTFTITQAIVSTVVNLVLRRSENDAVEREVRSVRSGSGVGDKYSERIVGDTSNGVAQWREYIDEIEVYRLTNVLSKFFLNVAIGDSIVIDEDGHFDLTEISAPATPGTNVGRLYAKEISGSSTVLAYKNDAGTERVLGEEFAVGALLGILQDRKTANTSGDAAVATTWNTADLNTEVYDRLGILSITSEEFTISAAGTYDIEWSIPAYGSGGSGTFGIKSRLYNVSDAAVAEIGTSDMIGGTASGSNPSGATTKGHARVTIAGSKTFRIERYSTSSAVAWGLATNAGVQEVYTNVVIRRG